MLTVGPAGLSQQKVARAQGMMHRTGNDVHRIHITALSIAFAFYTPIDLSRGN
jgi:hypothetical protein